MRRRPPRPPRRATRPATNRTPEAGEGGPRPASGLQPEGRARVGPHPTPAPAGAARPRPAASSNATGTRRSTSLGHPDYPTPRAAAPAVAGSGTQVATRRRGSHGRSTLDTNLDPLTQCNSQRGMEGRYSFWIHTLSPPPDFGPECESGPGHPKTRPIERMTVHPRPWHSTPAPTRAALSHPPRRSRPRSPWRPYAWSRRSRSRSPQRTRCVWACTPSRALASTCPR